MPEAAQRSMIILYTNLPKFAKLRKVIKTFAGIIMPEAAQRSMKFLYTNLPKFVKSRKVIKTFIGMTLLRMRYSLKILLK